MAAGLRLVFPALVFFVGTTVFAQSNVGVDIDSITDNRVEGSMLQGSLDLRLNVTGTGLEKAAAARVLIKEARDDRGTVLSKADADLPDFMPREYNSGTVSVSLGTPMRTAKSVKVKGTVELLVPSRDPSATVKVEKALSSLDKPLSAKALKAAKIEITPLSRQRLVAMMNERKLDETKIAALRAEGKAQGIPEKEIEMVIGLARAMEDIDGQPEEGAIVLSGREADFDRVYRVDVLGADGKPIDISTRSVSTRGEDSIMTLLPSNPPPADAALQLVLLTDKSRMSFPFELSFELP